MKNRGFTLAESLIVLGIIGVAAAILLPAINHFRPVDNKMSYLKVHDNITKMVHKIATNSNLYPACTIGANENEETKNCSEFPLFNTYHAEHDNSIAGDIKLCRLLAEELGGRDVACSANVYNSASTSGNDILSSTSFTTRNGMRWRISPQIPTQYNDFATGDAQFETAIYVDINGADKGPNCMSDDNCTNPDIFKFLVYADGNVVPSDTKGLSYLANRRNFFTKDTTANTANVSATFNVPICTIGNDHQRCLNGGGTWGPPCTCSGANMTWDDNIKRCVCVDGYDWKASQNACVVHDEGGNGGDDEGGDEGNDPKDPEACPSGLPVNKIYFTEMVKMWDADLHDYNCGGLTIVNPAPEYHSDRSEKGGSAYASCITAEKAPATELHIQHAVGHLANSRSVYVLPTSANAGILVYDGRGNPRGITSLTPKYDNKYCYVPVNDDDYSETSGGGDGRGGRR